jgi:HEPN domain-containing protein
MNRSDLQKLSRLRLGDAKILLDDGRYEGAYYLIGYAVECAFKACIAKQTKLYDFPNKSLTNSIYTHDLNTLLKFSGLENKHRDKSKKNANFELNWTIVKDWKEDARYSLEITRDKAEALYSAVVSRKDGILPWLQRLW